MDLNLGQGTLFQEFATFSRFRPPIKNLEGAFVENFEPPGGHPREPQNLGGGVLFRAPPPEGAPQDLKGRGLVLFQNFDSPQGTPEDLKTRGALFPDFDLRRAHPRISKIRCCFFAILMPWRARPGPQNLALRTVAPWKAHSNAPRFGIG